MPNSNDLESRLRRAAGFMGGPESVEQLLLEAADAIKQTETALESAHSALSNLLDLREDYLENEVPMGSLGRDTGPWMAARHAVVAIGSVRRAADAR